MPKSKRNRLITLSKVQKQPSREKNERLYTAIREELENHTYAFIFSVDNMRNTFLKDIRAQWEDSRWEPFFHSFVIELLLTMYPIDFSLARPK
jgi:mRNA turnover protein 4